MGYNVLGRMINFHPGYHLNAATKTFIRDRRFTCDRDVYDGGYSKLTGIVTEEDVPVSRKVYLFCSITKRVIRMTWSNTDGYYEFKNIQPNRQYLLFSEDYTGRFRPIIKYALKVI